MANALVWVLLGRKAGDNNQVLALAKAVETPFEEKLIAARSWELLPHLALGVTLAGIDRQKSSPLEAPWPNLVISAGRRNEPVARWIRAQSRGRTKLVHIGRPWAPLDCYDLIITTPQYFLPDQANILHLSLPLHRVNSAKAKAEAASLADRFLHLSRPLTTVLIGGNSGPFVYTAEKARRLAGAIDRLHAQTGGSVLVTDSPRTPVAFSEVFRRHLKAPVEAYWWHEQSHSEGANPYLAWLGLADRFVVSGESMSMIAEATAMERPLYLFDPGDWRPWWLSMDHYRYKLISHHLAMRLAPRRMRRDVARIQLALVRQQRARWIEDAPKLIESGETWHRVRAEEKPEVSLAAEKVRALLQ